MRFKLLLSVFLILCTCVSYAQTSANADFTKYAAKQDSLMIKAYERKDTASYGVLLKDFLSRYEALDEKNKKEFQPVLAGAYYNFACTYSLVQDKENALDYFDKSVQAGFYNYSHIMKDTDLDFIRNENRFKNLMEKIRGIGDYLYILGRAGEYNALEKRELPTFMYQPSDNPHLVELRKAFNLDSIAGHGYEISKFLNMMHWIHNLIRHDGSIGNPEVRNAMSMINKCKTEKRGLNCRGMAIVLNECYLAMGFKSRFVTCLPKDSLGIDQDCHVINMVYSSTMKKWLWIDPTFDAYVMNEKGDLLSIEEVRERIINGKPLILNPDANWNHSSSQTKENYLYTYMAKNLYMLECPVQSEYNLETKETGKNIEYARLLPLDYFKQEPAVATVENKESNTKRVTYMTNNPAAFWAVPNN